MNSGWTAPATLQCWGNECAVRYRLNCLIDTGANLNIQNKDYRLDCLSISYAKYNSVDVAKLLIDSDIDINIKNEDGLTPLHDRIWE